MGAMSWRATSSPLLTPGPASATGGEVLRLEATEGRHIVTGWPPKPRHLGTNPVAHIEKHFDHIRSAPTPHQLHSNFAERWDSIVAGGVPPPSLTRLPARINPAALRTESGLGLAALEHCAPKYCKLVCRGSAALAEIVWGQGARGLGG